MPSPRVTSSIFAKLAQSSTTSTVKADTQTKILDRFAPLLRPDGLLFAGHSENFFYNGRSTFRLRGKTVYELAN